MQNFKMPPPLANGINPVTGGVGGGDPLAPAAPPARVAGPSRPFPVPSTGGVVAPPVPAHMQQGGVDRGELGEPWAKHFGAQQNASAPIANPRKPMSGTPLDENQVLAGKLGHMGGF